MRPILTLSVLLAVTAGVFVGCKQSGSKETKNTTSTTTTQTPQPAATDEAERKRLADANAALEAEKKRLEEEKAKVQAELDKAKASIPATSSASAHCGRATRNNNGSTQISCREHMGTPPASEQQICEGGGSTTIPGFPFPFPMPNQQGGVGGGKWATGGCPRTVQGIAAVGSCKFIRDWSSSYVDVYYAPWTTENSKSDCTRRGGAFANP